MLDKTYRPDRVEQPIYDRWLASGAFAADPDADVRPWCVMMPPPNVTGSLHMGHALNMTLQDALTRWNMISGRETLWLPGKDHAGIATQNAVERQLAEEGSSRHDIGREKFEERVWQWKDAMYSKITEQLQHLGCACGRSWPRGARWPRPSPPAGGTAPARW